MNEFNWDAVLTEREARWFAECRMYLDQLWDEADCHVRNGMISDLRQLVEKYQREVQGVKR